MKKIHKFDEGELIMDVSNKLWEVYFHYDDEDINVITTSSYEIAIKFFNEEKKFL